MLPEQLHQKSVIEILHDLGNYLMSLEGHLILLASSFREKRARKIIQTRILHAQTCNEVLKAFRLEISAQSAISLEHLQAFASDLKEKLEKVRLNESPTFTAQPLKIRREFQFVGVALWHAMELIHRISPKRSAEPSQNKEIAIDRLIASSVSLLESTARESNVSLSFSFPPEKLCLVRGNRTDLSRLLMNLLLNAIQAMPQGGKIKISATNHTGAEKKVKEWVHIEIADNGPGIAKAAQKKIFLENFSTKGNLHGLGLSIAHRIVEAHHGKIHVKSQMKRGTTFTILLPAKKLKKT